jgi:hypothetical protein
MAMIPILKKYFANTNQKQAKGLVHIVFQKQFFGKGLTENFMAVSIFQTVREQEIYEASERKPIRAAD